MSDEEAEKLMDYLDLKQRLEQVKGTIRSKKKSNIAGDISGKVAYKDDELDRARERKTNLERKMADLVASSPYLQRRVKNEETIDENAKKRLKQLANIQ
jgi:polyhydroxyalkanoate synthesis regulator phasin